MTDKEMCTRIQTVIDRWPIVRASVSAVLASRCLEKIDDIFLEVAAILEQYRQER